MLAIETVAREILGEHHVFKTAPPKTYQDKLSALNSQQYYQQLRALSAEEYETAISRARDEQLITQEAYEQVQSLFKQLSILFPPYELLDRGEDLTQDKTEHLETKKQRLANPVHTATVTSVSTHKDGAEDFHGPGTTRTIYEADPNRPVISQTECEVLLPKGIAYLFTENSEGELFAREVNSPGIVPWGDYWSSTAIAFAYENDLSKPYKAHPEERTTVNNRTIPRSNHALAHAYRVMIYMDIIVDYFAHHAKDESFKAFCQNITSEERAWLRVAAAYSITGRESEISAGDNPEQYDQYRKASQKHMEDFLALYPPPHQDKKMRESMLDIVRWMGNPNYEKSTTGKPSINQCEDPEEKEHRNFTHRILTLAHNLDLVRCYGADEFNGSMEPAQTLTTPGTAQAADYQRMVTYAIDLNRAHGDTLRTEVSPEGGLRNTSQSYQPPFGLISTNLRQLEEITRTVPKPSLTESYQFKTFKDKWGELTQDESPNQPFNKPTG